MDYLNAYLSGIRGSFIPEHLMDEIEKATSVASIFDLLKKTHYGKYLDYRESIQSSIEKALEKRFIEVIHKIGKAVPESYQDLYRLFIYEYEARYVLLNYDQKYRGVENPRLYSLLDNKQKLMKAYKTRSLLSFLRSMKMGREINLDLEFAKDMKPEDRVPVALDYLVLEIKRELIKRTKVISSVLKKELAYRAYILERYLGKPIIPVKPLPPPEEWKDKPLEEIEYLLEEYILSLYRKKYPASWYLVEKAYVVLKMLEHEKLQILKKVRV
ncbi:MAG: V-type ATPase subunit [Candidatus Micrarchaeota archaeon]|nr:V-type ATPase subunit [Candidatus Micrarchaeota archaeon]